MALHRRFVAFLQPNYHQHYLQSPNSALIKDLLTKYIAENITTTHYLYFLM